jgi:hypothetical protein
MGSWLHQVTHLWVANWPEFLPKIFVRGPYFEELSCILCFLVCFIIRVHPFSTFILLLYLPLSLVKTKGQIEIVYVDELWVCHCPCHCHFPKLQFHNHKTSEYVIAYNHTYCRLPVTLLCKATVSTEDRNESKNGGLSESMVALLQSCGSENVESGRSGCFWDSNILLQSADKLDTVSDAEQLRHAWIGRCVGKCRNFRPVHKAWRSEQVYMGDHEGSAF